MAIDDLQILFPSASVPVLNLYIRKATTMILKYMNNDDILNADNYVDAVVEYVTLCLNKKGNEGLQSFGQGSRSGTYVSDLTESVTSLLPPPYLKMMGRNRRDNHVG
jgi:hypothetical protein